MCLASGACDAPRAVTSRVTPNYLDKVDLIPSEFSSPDGGAHGGPEDEPPWFARTSVLGGAEPFGFSLLPRYRGIRTVRWEVTESFLIVRDITDGVTTGGMYPVFAVYRINSHFDIGRTGEYAGGEFLPFEGERDPNAPPWYQRRMMSVDWSQDLIDRQFGSGPAFELPQEPIPHYVNNPNDPELPRFWRGSEPGGIAADAASIGLTRIAITSHALVLAVATDGGVAGDASVDAVSSGVEVSLLTEYARQPF